MRNRASPVEWVHHDRLSPVAWATREDWNDVVEERPRAAERLAANRYQCTGPGGASGRHHASRPASCGCVRLAPDRGRRRHIPDLRRAGKTDVGRCRLFVGLVITALLRPLVDLLSRKLPRALAVAVTLLLTIVAIGGIFTFVADSVAEQTSKASAQFITGLNEIERSLAGAPFHIRAVDLTQVGQQIRGWVTQNGGSLAGRALGGAGVAAEVLTGLALALFCSVFFLSSGNRIWTWLLT